MSSGRFLTHHGTWYAVRAALAVATRAPSIHNSQPWRLELGREGLHLYADPARWLPRTDSDRRDLVVSCGALLQHLEVALAGAGMASRVHRLPDRSRPDHLALLELHAGDLDEDALRQLAVLVRRRSDRRPFRPARVPPAAARLLAAVAAQRGAQLRTLDQPDDRAALQLLLQEAVADQEGDSAYQHELALWAGSTASPDGIPTTNLTERTGPRWSHDRHLPAGDVQVPIGTAPDAATFVVLATSGDDRLSRLRAGEALGAVLVAATELGLSSCVLSQPLEVAATRVRVRDDLLGATACPQLLVRLGRPRSSVPLPVTPRRDVDDVLTVMPDPAVAPFRTR